MSRVGMSRRDMSLKAQSWQVLSGAKRFEAALRQRPCARSEHFAVHRAPLEPTSGKLSTGEIGTVPDLVDDLTVPHLGLVVPKRHAKRAVTRNLIKRQIRAVVQDHADRLPAGDWVVRLRAPINRQLFPSARSQALAAVLRAELLQLVGKIAGPAEAEPC